MHKLAFDPYQFKKPPRAVSAETELTFGDFGHFEHHPRSRRWVPLFAANNEQLRAVIAQMVWNGARSHYKVMPDGLDTAALSRLSNEKIAVLRHGEKYGEYAKSQIVERHLEINERVPWTELLVAVAYYSWRLLYKAPDVAERLGITLEHVRMIRFRMCETARKLGFETFERHPSVAYWKGRKRKSQAFAFTLDDVNRIVKLWNEGLSTTEIVERTGIGFDFVLRLLKSRGLYYHRKKRHGTRPADA